MSRKRIGFIIVTALLSLLFCFFSALLIRRVDCFVPLLGPELGLKRKEIREFTAIFGQLRNASLRCPVLPMLLLSAGSVWLVSAIRCKNVFARISLRILLSLILTVILFLAALLLTKVNTIRLANVLLSLIALFI